ncbi:MAG: cytochrome c [Acidobacteria bacterium]|nr:cytochrome c [Acidobacteriota bacterium]
MVLTTVLCAVGSALAMAQGRGRGAAARTVWDGIFMEDQVARGATAFSANCVRCHGEQLEGITGKALVGDTFWRDFDGRTVQDLLDYVSKNMPNGAQAGTLAPDVYLDLVAFILSRNDFPSGGAALTADSSVGVRILRKGETAPRPLPENTAATVVGCLAKTGTREWTVNNGTEPERVDPKGVNASDATRDLGNRSYPLLFVLQSLDKLVGHRVRVKGILVGEGGSNGVNLTQIDSLSETCP